MATGTVPAAVPGPPDPPAQAPTNTAPADPPKGFLAAMVAPVEPARPTTFDIVPTDGTSDPAAGPDGVLDRSAPGVSSASFRGAAEDATKASDPTGARAKKSIWKEFWLAAATRWAKGGGATNKRLDLAKARAQAKAHQVKENRTTTVAKSGGLPVRNTGGSGSGTNKGSDKSRNNSSGRNTNGAGRGGSGGGRGSGGGSGNNGSGGSGGAGRGSDGSGRSKDTNSPSKHPKRNHSANGASGGSGTGGGRGPGAGTGKHDSGSTWSSDGKNGQGLAPASGGKGGGKPDAKGSSHGPAGKGAGAAPGAGGGTGKPGKAGKVGAPGKPGTSADPKDPKGASKKVNLTKTPKNPKDPKNSNGKPPADPAAQNGPQNPPNATGKTNRAGQGQKQPTTPKTPLQKARETGHGDGTKARRAVDHVLAYKDGVRDGWDDEKTKNAKEHERLDKAHDTHKPKDGGPQGVIVTEKEDDGVSTDVKPLTVQSIDANTLTLGTGNARTTVGRKELRNFKQYERKLDAKVTVLQKIAEACSQLQKEAENESRECQLLAEQAKDVKGGEKMIGKLNRLAEAAKNQAAEAAELARRARRAAEVCKVVLTNIQTRYAPLYKAVVDSDETKPAELRFYNDKGSYAHAA